MTDVVRLASATIVTRPAAAAIVSHGPHEPTERAASCGPVTQAKVGWVLQHRGNYSQMAEWAVVAGDPIVNYHARTMIRTRTPNTTLDLTGG